MRRVRCEGVYQPQSMVQKDSILEEMTGASINQKNYSDSDPILRMQEQESTLVDLQCMVIDPGRFQTEELKMVTPS
jgi:hypothetical protein